MLKLLPVSGLTSLLAVLAATAPAAGQTACGDRLEVLADLQSRYSEERGAAGITQSGGLLEITVAPSGTWTILLTLPGQPACVVAAGEDWQFMPDAVGAVAIADRATAQPRLGVR
jgi:hypothetical protein